MPPPEQHSASRHDSQEPTSPPPAAAGSSFILCRFHAGLAPVHGRRGPGTRVGAMWRGDIMNRTVYRNRVRQTDIECSPGKWEPIGSSMGILETGDESASSSDDTLCGGVESSKQDNVLTKDFLRWSRSQGHDPKTERTLIERYEALEEKVLDKLEIWLSYMDNFVAIQAIFPSLERKTRNSSLFRPLNFCIRQVAKIYIVMILIYLKRFLVRLRKINRLIGVVKTEAAIIRGNFLMKSSNVAEYHERCLRVLYTEKVKAIVEIVGYFNDLLLNLGLVLKRFRLGRMTRKMVGFVSWIVNIYRLCRDEGQDAKNDAVIRELQSRVGL